MRLSKKSKGWAEERTLGNVTCPMPYFLEHLCYLPKLPFSLSSWPVEVPFHTIFLLELKGKIGFLSKTRFIFSLLIIE
jgi:hypothetical protein